MNTTTKVHGKRHKMTLRDDEKFQEMIKDMVTEVDSKSKSKAKGKAKFIGKAQVAGAELSFAMIKPKVKAKKKKELKRNEKNIR